MAETLSQSQRARKLWRRHLATALRTATACAIVGGATLYGPKCINRIITFPAFSYVTVILIITDATLGDTLRGCWLAIYATAQGACPAMLSLWLIRPERLTASTTAAVVGLSAFLVVLPGNTHLISKRIALGQIVIVYVVAYINGASTGPITYPAHMAASTAAGAAATVVALLLPYPRLASCEVKENCKLYVENASERLKLFVKAFSAEDNILPRAMISQANSLNNTATKLLQSIKTKQGSMKWERLIAFKFFKSQRQKPGEILQNLETILTGMQIAAQNCSDFPVKLMNNELKNGLITVEEQILNQVKSVTILPHSDTDRKDNKKLLQTFQTCTNIPLTSKDLPFLFFVFCLKLLETDISPATPPDFLAKQALNIDPKENKNQPLSKITIFNKRRLLPALRSSFSLGFAVFFGLIYSKKNGYWAGLPVAISLASAREATFKVTNIKAQGTVLGTVYGVLGCFIFEKYAKIRFISLLPWFVFCSFLCQSRMYGQAGGISAVIGAVLILGRNNFGSPSEFAIARIVETFIGLSCSLMVDMLLQPERAAVMAKIRLTSSLEALHESVGSILGSFSRKFSSEDVVFNQKKLKIHVNELGKLIEEAEVEPNFWFLPFHCAGYRKLKGSFSKMVDLLDLGGTAVRVLGQETRKMECKAWKEGADKLEHDLKFCIDTICSGIKCFQEVILVKSLVALENKFANSKSSLDLESGRLPILRGVPWSRLQEDDEMEVSTDSFLEHLQEIMSHIGFGNDEEGLKESVILSLSSLVFCMNGLIRETKEIEKAIKELVLWENPSSQANLHDISCKIHALEKSTRS